MFWKLFTKKCRGKKRMRTRRNRRKSVGGGEDPDRYVYGSEFEKKTIDKIRQKNTDAKKFIEDLNKSLAKANIIIDSFTTSRKLKGKNRPIKPNILNSEIPSRNENR